MGQDFKSGDFVKINKWSSELNLAQYILRGGGSCYFEYPQSKLQTSSEQGPLKESRQHKLVSFLSLLSHIHSSWIEVALFAPCPFWTAESILQISIFTRKTKYGIDDDVKNKLIDLIKLFSKLHGKIHWR